MAQVDAFRFLHNVAKLFAPHIQESQVFTAYIGENNSYTVLADNILRASGGNSLNSDDIDDLEQRFIALEAQASEFETFCNDVSSLQTQIQSLSGSYDSEGTVDFDFAYLHGAISDIRSDIATLYSKIDQLSN